MKRHIRRNTQRGVTLVVGLIMLVLITLIVVAAFTLSSSNLKAVGNMQFRDEAVAAASVAIEQVVSSNFTALPVASTVQVDIDNNGADDYTVTVGVPQCVQAVEISSGLAGLSGVTANVPSTVDYNTVWEIQAQVTSNATGASVTMRQGIRRRMTQLQYAASACV